MTYKASRNKKLKDWRSELNRLQGAYAAGTLRAYRADIHCFVKWCEARNRNPFPATPNLLAKFIADQTERCASSTIKRRLAAVSKMHRLMKLENPVSDEEVKLALRRSFRGKFQRPRQATGITKKMRDQLIGACSSNDLADIRDRALIATGYDALARRSELSSLYTQDISITESGSKLIVRRSKNDQYGYGRIAYLSKNTTKLICDWMESANITEGPLFRPIRNNFVGYNALHPHSISRIIKRAATKAGLSENVVKSLSGHSMRIGAAQEMMVAGFDILPIMVAGGWKTTNVVARYIENADISPLLGRFRK